MLETDSEYPHRVAYGGERLRVYPLDRRQDSVHLGLSGNYQKKVPLLLGVPPFGVDDADSPSDIG